MAGLPGTVRVVVRSARAWGSDGIAWNRSSNRASAAATSSGVLVTVGPVEAVVVTARLGAVVVALAVVGGP